MADLVGSTAPGLLVTIIGCVFIFGGIALARLVEMKTGHVLLGWLVLITGCVIIGPFFFPAFKATETYICRFAKDPATCMIHQR